jgi:hypothetical protein
MELLVSYNNYLISIGVFSYFVNISVKEIHVNCFGGRYTVHTIRVIHTVKTNLLPTRIELLFFKFKEIRFTYKYDR